MTEAYGGGDANELADAADAAMKLGAVDESAVSDVAGVEEWAVAKDAPDLEMDFVVENAVKTEMELDVKNAALMEE